MPSNVIRAKVSNPTIKGKISSQFIKGRLNFNTVEVDRDPYTGEYEITPTQAEQVLPTKNKAMSENIIIKPIPSYYGLITYDGFSITVS